MYSSTKCPFCYERLREHPNRTRYCHCENQYSVLIFNNNRFSVRFHIGDYKFHVGEYETIITDLSPGKPIYPVYRAKHSVIINKDNYLEVVERFKKLQLFI